VCKQKSNDFPYHQEKEKKMKNVLLKFSVLAVASVGLLASSVWASPIYYEATAVTGTGTVTYGMGSAINDAPIFDFAGTYGTVDNQLFNFTPGEYTISFTLNGFWADFNNDSAPDFALPDTTLTTGPLTLPALPSPSGNYGQLSWDIDLNNGGWVSYDFGNVGNMGINSLLAFIDPDSNGSMDAEIGWDKLRVELNPTTAPVPEPATMLLFGTGLACLAGVVRRKKK
jgi:hypothetical protein